MEEGGGRCGTECFMSPCSFAARLVCHSAHQQCAQEACRWAWWLYTALWIDFIFLFPSLSFSLPFFPPLSLSLSLQTEHRDLSSIPLVVFGLLQHEHKARKLKTCWKLAAGRTFCKTVCDCCSFLTDVSATLCAQEDHHLLSPYSVKGMCLL